jgi:hypothetical protein
MMKTATAVTSICFKGPWTMMKVFQCSHTHITVQLGHQHEIIDSRKFHSFPWGHAKDGNKKTQMQTRESLGTARKTVGNKWQQPTNTRCG